jgi:hypothetical protein
MGALKRMLFLIVSLRTQLSCATYETPLPRGKLNHDAGEEGIICISPVQGVTRISTKERIKDVPSRAMRRDVFPCRLVRISKKENLKLSYRTGWTDNEVESRPEEKLSLDFENESATRRCKCAISLVVIGPCEHGIAKTNQFRCGFIGDTRIGNILRAE